MVLTILSLISGVYYVSTNMVLESYRHLESKEMDRNVSRALDAYHQREKNLGEKCLDWAHFDDTYKFASDLNKNYIKTNLSDVVLAVDNIMFLDPKGKIIYQRKVATKNNPNGLEGQKIRAALCLDGNGKSSLDTNKDYEGTLSVAGQHAIVAAKRILPTNGKGTPRGWIVFTQAFGTKELQDLGSETHLAVDFDNIKGPKDEHAQLAVERLHHATAFSIPVSNDAIAGFGAISDLHGAPLFLIKILEPRSVYTRGLASSRYTFQVILICGIVFCVVVLCLWEYFALSRMAKLSLQVERLSVAPSREIALAGNDEFSRLATKINGVLTGLETSREKLRQNNAQLTNSVEKLQATNSILEHALEGIAEVSELGIITYTNRTFSATLGFGENELVGKQFSELVYPDDLERFETFIGIVQNLGKAELDLRFQGQGGSIIYLEAVLVGTYNDAGSLSSIHFFTKDVTERKRLETQIEHQAFHDPLTGLANRSMFLKRLSISHAASQRHGDSVGVIFIDLDNFKKINDTLGHHMGDRFLILISERLSGCIRPGDMVARLAGDEFVILLERAVAVSEVTAVAERIQEALSHPLPLNEEEMFGSASMGIAFSDGGAIPPDRLVKNADTAMYQAKARGKNKFVVFEDSMDIISLDQLELEQSLASALGREEFFLEYQPIYDLKHNRVVGVEALLRWNHPTRGVLAPNLFLPIAEEAGLMLQIGAWTFREACRQLKVWEKRRRDLFCCVNLSAKQIQSFEIVGEIVSAFEEHGVAPDRLQIEITEKAAQALAGSSSSTLSAIRRAGVRVAIDDFGTGFASNASEEVHIADALKIDHSLTQKIDLNDNFRQLISTIISTGHSHGLQVFAEGVQTENQLSKLKALGCRYAQGYYFSKPLRPEDIEASILPKRVA